MCAFLSVWSSLRIILTFLLILHAWHLTISHSKCSNIIIISRSKTPELLQLTFTKANMPLPQVDCAHDLGVKFDSRLSYSANISNAVSSAFISASLVLKCFLSRAHRYATWCLYAADVKLKKSVRWKFTKQVCDTETDLRQPVSTAMNLNTRPALCLYNILFGHIDIDPNELLVGPTR